MIFAIKQFQRIQCLYLPNEILKKNSVLKKIPLFNRSLSYICVCEGARLFLKRREEKREKYL